MGASAAVRAGMADEMTVNKSRQTPGRPALDWCTHDMLREVRGWVTDLRAEFSLIGNLRVNQAINDFAKRLLDRIDDALLHEVAPKEATDA